MEKNMIPEELDALIREYLTDDVLTDKERQVILRKAASLGLDQDEIDLYLDAQVQKIDQATETAARRMKSKECPHCQTPVPQFTDKCPKCHRYITPQANEELKDILDNLEESLIDLKDATDILRSKATVERYARKARVYYGSNPKVQNLLVEVEKEMIEAEKKLKSLKRSKAIKFFLTNPWTYGGLFIILSLLVILFFFLKAYFSHNEDDAAMWVMGMIFFGGACIGLTILFIKKVCQKN